MVEPQSYTQKLLCRVGGLCAGQKAKALVVSCGDTVRAMAQHIAYLQLHEVIEIIDVTGTDTSGKFALSVDPRFVAVLIAVDNPLTMIKVGRLCMEYQSAGIPVVVVDGWPPPMDPGLFRAETAHSGNLSVAGMFDLAAAYSKNGNRGDVLEFGTFQGFTLQCAYHAFNKRQAAASRRFIAFDSFAGIIGKKAGEGFHDGAYATSEKSFRFANFLAEVPNDRVMVVSGPFSETLARNADETRRGLGPTEAALVHIDCDVEEPAKLALDFATPYMKQGTLLLFDEYDMHQANNAKGERSALRAWLAENPAFEVEPYRCYHSHARSFIVHRR